MADRQLRRHGMRDYDTDTDTDTHDAASVRPQEGEMMADHIPDSFVVSVAPRRRRERLGDEGEDREDEAERCEDEGNRREDEGEHREDEGDVALTVSLMPAVVLMPRLTCPSQIRHFVPADARRRARG